MKLIDYCRERASFLSLILFCTLTNIIVLLIYQVPLEPLLYATLICLVFLFFLGVYDFHRLKGRHQVLSSYHYLSEIPLEHQIKHPTMSEHDYHKIIQTLEQEIQEIQTATTKMNQERADFYMMWVHQTKTPISALRLLLQTDPQNLSTMKNELFKIERYVDIILGYSRLDDMNHDLTLKRYPLDSMVKQAIKKYTPLFIYSKLRLDLEPMPFQVLTDEKWLVFVLEQLISNSLKYTPKGTIHISAHQETHTNTPKSILIIEDTGIGIAPEDLPRIFERGFTGYNGRMDKKASGLGLYLCKTILKRLGHKITITSVLNKGTKVILEFHEFSQYTENNLDRLQ